jgi:hypothetical protein
MVDKTTRMPVMGRPPIGKKAMTATDRQRRWRQKRRRRQQEPPPLARVAAEPASRVAAQPASREAAERIEDPERQLHQAHTELELARGVAPEAVGDDHPHPCFVCHKWPPEAKGMVTASRPRWTLFLCNGCIAEMHRFSDEIIAGRT